MLIVVFVLMFACLCSAWVSRVETSRRAARQPVTILPPDEIQELDRWWEEMQSLKARAERAEVELQSWKKWSNRLNPPCRSCGFQICLSPELKRLPAPAPYYRIPPSDPGWSWK